jgi:MoxR-like ATPase
VIDRERLLAVRDRVRTVHVGDEVEAYVAAVARATRDHADIDLGASPRGTVALYRAAQAAAVLAGREFVIPDDVKDLAVPVLAHRLVLNIDRSLHGATVERAIASVLSTVPAPPVLGG